jgi:hypothetical protein
MKITIKRYFERTRQIADFVPVKTACEASAEVNVKPNITARALGEGAEAISGMLDQFVQSEVEKTLMGYTPACIGCGGKAIFPKKVLNKEGICAQCQSDNEMKLRDLRRKTPEHRNQRPNKLLPKLKRWTTTRKNSSPANGQTRRSCTKSASKARRS